MNRRAAARRGLRALCLCAIVLCCVGWGRQSAFAQGQVCKNLVNIQVCGDTLVAESGEQFVLQGNIKVGMRNGPLLVHATDMPQSFKGEDVNENTYLPRFIHTTDAEFIATQGSGTLMTGVLRFINDPNPAPLLATHYEDDPTTDEVDILLGRLFVDPTLGRIFIPPAGGVPLFTQKGIDRNSNMRFPFLDRTGLRDFFKGSANVPTEFERMQAEFSLETKRFNGTLPTPLKLDIPGDNGNLEVTIRASFTDAGVFSGSVDNFKMTLAGLVLDVKNVVLKLNAQNPNKSEFEAGTVDVSKVDNPSLPNLEPSQPELVFRFSKLVYKEGKFSIAGVTTPVNDWVFGDAFSMKNQSIGLTNDTQQGVTFFTVNSTLVFGVASDGTTSIPVTMRISRKDVDGEPRALFEAGIQNITPRFGLMRVNLQGVTLVGDAVEDFYGIKATTAALQWPQNMGGKTAAGISGFRFGIKKDKELVFNLANGTIGTPEFDSGVIRGTLQGTVGVISDTVTFQLSGNMTLKIAGNTNVGTGATMTIRSGKGVCGASIQDGTSNTFTPPTFSFPFGQNQFGNLLTQPTQDPPPPPPEQSGDCLARYEQKLTNFSIKVAGFTLELKNPRGREDGGFAADEVVLKLPTGMGTGGSISKVGLAELQPASTNTLGSTGFTLNGIQVTGNGNIQLAGGSFELAPITVAGYQFVGIKGGFVKKPDGGYEFKGGGKFPLPGIEPGTGSQGISAEIIIRTNENNAFSGLGVTLEFSASPGIPIGATGMELVRIGGSFDLNNQTVTFGVSLRAASQARLPAPLNVPIVFMDAGLSVQLNPFLMQANASMTVVIFQVANASIKLGDGQGFTAGSPGLFVEFNVNAFSVKGQARLRVGKVTINNEVKTRVAGAATLEIVVPKVLLLGLAPNDVTLFGVNFTGGPVLDARTNPPRETTGILATIRPLGVNLSAFVDFGCQLSCLLTFPAAKKLTFVDAAQVRMASASGIQRFASRRMAAVEAQELGFVLTASQIAGGEAIYQDEISETLPYTSSLALGIRYLSGAPELRLRLPDGSIVTEAGAEADPDPDGVKFIRAVFTPQEIQEAEQETKFQGDIQSFMIFLPLAGPGLYTLIVDNAPEDYETLTIEYNQQPEVELTAENCGGASIPGVAVTCDGVESGSVVSMSWIVTDTDSPGARVTAGLVRLDDEGAPDFTAVILYADEQPLGPGGLAVTLDETPSGSYKLFVTAEDMKNAPATALSSFTILVIDNRPPAVPQDLEAVSQAGELLVTWTQNTERDLAGYEIGFGIVDPGKADHPDDFVYARDMGPKIVITGTNNIVDAKIWGLDDDTEVFYALRAYDYSGNYSDWTPMQRAKPWALSPAAWLPAPNSTDAGTRTPIQVNFNTNMVRGSMIDALRLLDGEGNEVDGDLYFLTDPTGQEVWGLYFRPKGALELDATYRVVVKGGAEGVQTADGKTMQADYVWLFTVGEDDGPEPEEPETGAKLFAPTMLR